jgi:hypothetical protein
MQEDSIACKDCRSWVQYVEDDPELGPRMSDFGLCFHARSANWFLRVHKDVRCTHGELKKKEIPAH